MFNRAFAAVLAVMLACATLAPAAAYAQQAAPPPATSPGGFDGLVQLLAALQSIIAALNALAGLGMPPMAPPPPPPPPPMPPMPPMNPIDPNMMMPPLDPNSMIPPPPTGVGCQVEFDEFVNLGTASFLAEGEVIEGVVDQLGYPSRTVGANQVPDMLCLNPGISQRIVQMPMLPLEFTNFNPPIGAQDDLEATFTARDNRRVGGCRVGAAGLPATVEMDCQTIGVVEYTFDAQMISPGLDRSMWAKRVGATVFSTVRLRILTPSEQLLVMLLGRPLA